MPSCAADLAGETTGGPTGHGTSLGDVPFEPEQHRGSWVAVDREGERVVAEAPSLEELQADLADLAASTSEPVLIRRIPADDDPIFVGLG